MDILINFENIETKYYIIMKNLKSLSRKELKTIKGSASDPKCAAGDHWCPDAAVCVPIIVECYIVVPPDLPDGVCLSC